MFVFFFLYSKEKCLSEIQLHQRTERNKNKSTSRADTPTQLDIGENIVKETHTILFRTKKVLRNYRTPTLAAYRFCKNTYRYSKRVESVTNAISARKRGNPADYRSDACYVAKNIKLASAVTQTRHLQFSSLFLFSLLMEYAYDPVRHSKVISVFKCNFFH